MVLAGAAGILYLTVSGDYAFLRQGNRL